jgi:hypothetical protein
MSPTPRRAPPLPRSPGPDPVRARTLHFAVEKAGRMLDSESRPAATFDVSSARIGEHVAIPKESNMLQRLDPASGGCR